MNTEQHSKDDGCDCGWPDGEAEVVEVGGRAQSFFQSYADESRKPHCSDRDKGWIANLLLRAEEAGLYKSEAK